MITTRNETFPLVFAAQAEKRVDKDFACAL